MPANQPPTLGSRISPAELPVLAGLARGQTIAEIGQTLHRSPLTIKTHVWRLAHRTGHHKQSGIVGHSYRHGYLTQLPIEPRPPVTLSHGQMETLIGLADGLTYAEIAARAWRSLDTAKTHSRRLFVNLDARTGAHAVALGYQHGHLTITTPATITNAA